MPDFEGKPIRKRGYYRAVKRGAEWAVRISKKKGLDFLMAFCYRNFDWKSMVTHGSSFLKHVEKDDAWAGGTIIVPFKFS